jgi:thiol-disulfide isomerase/thioredoxin
MKHRSLRTVAAALAATILGTFSASAAPQWNETFEAAQKQAHAEKKPILIDFTGSTWCPPCIQLNKEVFKSKTFQEYAEKNLVLMKVDFPDPVSEPKVGMDFVKRFIPGDVRLPTVIIASPEGKQLGTVAYESDKPEAFIKKVEKVTKK